MVISIRDVYSDTRSSLSNLSNFVSAFSTVNLKAKKSRCSSTAKKQDASKTSFDYRENFGWYSVAATIIKVFKLQLCFTFLEESLTQ